MPATRYATLGKRDLFIDFASRKPCGHPVHRALAGLQAGDEVTLEREGKGVAVFDRGRVEIGRLSKSAAEDWPDWRLSLIEHARVLGLVGRKLADCDTEQYRQKAAVPVWEYPILDVCYRVQHLCLSENTRSS